METTLEKLQETIIYLDKAAERIPFISFSYFCLEDKIFHGGMVDTVLNEKFSDFNIKSHRGYLVPKKYEILLRSKVELSGCPMRSS